MASSLKRTTLARILAIVFLCLLLFAVVFCSAYYGTEPGQNVENWRKDHADEQRPLVVNINTATVDEFLALDGMDVETAERIVANRNRRGRFYSIRSLTRIDGISETDVERWEPYIVV